MKRYIWFILPLFIVLTAFTKVSTSSSSAMYFADDKQIKWVTFEEALELNAKEPKMIFIDFYTDWCSWCKKMDANTFANPQIAELMNNGFYAVKFNAESDQKITWEGEVFELDHSGRRPAHELAALLATTDGRLGYPTFVILDEEFKKQKAYQGYKTVDALKQILEFYGVNDNYKKQNWIQFIQGTKSTSN